MKTIIVFGAMGQVAWELQRSLSLLGKIYIYGRKEVDFTDDIAIAEVIRSISPQIIVNAVAYTHVDKAESDINMAYQVNGKAVSVIAQEAAKIDALFIHYSTDYVYEGTGQYARCETDIPHPINIYGASKYEGEKEILSSGCRYIIFRTSWVYGFHGHNFIKTMIQLMQARENLSVIYDQIGAPTGAELIADVTAQVIAKIEDQPIREIYHLAAAGETSWYEYAQFIKDILQQLSVPIITKKINPINTIEYPTAAQRPLNSRLGLEKIERDFGFKMPHWQLGVERVIREIVGENNE